MRVLLTGADGMLGSDWVPDLRADGHDVFTTNRSTMDVTDLAAVRTVIGQQRPELVIHTAAHTDCDQGERDPDLTFRVNLIGSWNVALACQDVSAQMAYVSSCGIFNGQQREPYTELDEPDPQTQHHKSKYRAEQVVSQLLRESYIFRPGWLFGGRADHHKNFVARRHQEAQQSTELKSADDRFGSPTYTLDFARAAMAIIRQRAFGLYHLVNEQPCSRFEYVSGCIETLGLTTKVIPVSSEHFPRLAPAPVSEALSNYFLGLRGFAPMRPWRDALQEYVNQRLRPELVGVK